MRRKFAVLLVTLGALIALAIPASSVAATEMTPMNAEFFIEGATPGAPVSSPTIKTAYGSCPISRIKATAPGYLEKNPIMPATIVPGTCSTGTSISFSGKWNLRPVSKAWMLLVGERNSLTMRFSSLPGCKLTSPASTLYGAWVNGSSSNVPATYQAQNNGFQLYWENDSPGTCSKYGTRETAAVYENFGTPGFSYVRSSAFPAMVRIEEVPN